MNETQAVELGSVALPNGLRIYFYDHSRPVAGDRVFVQLLICVPVPVLESYFIECDDSSTEYQAFTRSEGNEIDFLQTKTRNFVAQTEAAPLLVSMKEEFLRANLVYLGKPSFPEMFVMKRYREWRASSSWQDAHRRNIEAAEKKERESE